MTAVACAKFTQKLQYTIRTHEITCTEAPECRREERRRIIVAALRRGRTSEDQRQRTRHRGGGERETADGKQARETKERTRGKDVKKRGVETGNGRREAWRKRVRAALLGADQRKSSRTLSIKHQTSSPLHSHRQEEEEEGAGDEEVTAGGKTSHVCGVWIKRSGHVTKSRVFSLRPANERTLASHPGATTGDKQDHRS